MSPRAWTALLALAASLCALPALAQTTASGWNDQGLEKGAKGDPAGAIADFTRAIELDASYVVAYVNRGNLRTVQKDFDGAIEDFDRAIELNPRSAAAYDGRGVARLGKNDLVFARDDFSKAISLDPKLASARTHRDNLDGALRGLIREMEQRIRSSPEDATAYAMRGDGYLVLGRYGLAISDYQNAIRLSPDNPVAYNNLAWLLATADDPAVHDPARALALALKAGELSKWNEPSIWSTLAAAYARNGNFAKAIEWQEKAVSAAPRAGDSSDRRRLRAYREGRMSPD